MAAYRRLKLRSCHSRRKHRLPPCHLPFQKLTTCPASTMIHHPRRFTRDPPRKIHLPRKRRFTRDPPRKIH